MRAGCDRDAVQIPKDPEPDREAGGLPPDVVSCDDVGCRRLAGDLDAVAPVEHDGVSGAGSRPADCVPARAGRYLDSNLVAQPRGSRRIDAEDVAFDQIAARSRI